MTMTLTYATEQDHYVLTSAINVQLYAIISVNYLPEQQLLAGPKYLFSKQRLLACHTSYNTQTQN